LQSGHATTGYVPSHLEEIKRRLSIVDIVQAKVNLKKTGRNYKGVCPFHNEKSGSFFVFPETSSYYCFGCHETGDIFGFVMKTEGLSFGEALEQLAARAGVQLPERTSKETAENVEEQNRKAERERLKEVNAAAATYFQHLLSNSKEGLAAREYLTKREVNHESIEQFGLGYALDSWSGLLDFLTSKNRFKLEELVKAGLVVAQQDDDGVATGKYFDRFRGRLMFPIRDRQGAVIAFGGRVLENAPKDSPKYLNSPQTILFDKSSVLYGFDLAKEAIRRADRAVIVEGYMDVIVAHQHGFNNVVAPLGTALNPKHVGLIKRLTKRVVLALDADAAGEMASLKGIEVMKQGFDTKIVPVPNARGLVRFEQELDADVRVAVLPKGKDPDEVVREGGGRWRELIERALPTVDYYFAAVGASVDLNSARGKSDAVERLALAIVEVRDRIQREHYIQKLARLTHLDGAIIRNEVAKAARTEQQQIRKAAQEIEVASSEPEIATYDDNDAESVPTPTIKKAKPSKVDLTAEDFLLAFLLRYSREGLEVLGTNEQPVGIEDFTQSENRQIFQALLSGVSVADMTLEENLAVELQPHFLALQAHTMSQPELIDLFSIRQAMLYQLDRVRETRLRQLYEQGSVELEDEQAEAADVENIDLMWQQVSEIASQLRIYYPKPSPLFQDTRSYK
jgi:DNA primase